jgi:hypothetical protein
MGLNAAVYADDGDDSELASLRIGNLDTVVRLRESIKKSSPAATVLLTKVLYSAFHCGDTLERPDLTIAKDELPPPGKQGCQSRHKTLEQPVAGGG